MASADKLKALFVAYNEGDSAKFVDAAESIIMDELAANHHRLANELKRALVGVERKQTRNHRASELSYIPKDRRNGDALISLRESTVSREQVVFAKGVQHRIDRVLEEHRKQHLLRRSGYLPKSRLLFWGPPGCGKTHTAYLVARELGLPIGTLRLNAIISSFLGDTASHIQRVFDLASSTPMVLLLDEVDALGKDRNDPNDVGELKRIVNSLLQAMDSFNSDCSILIAASNHQYLLDPALWRRFDDIIEFPLPIAMERERLLEMLLNGVMSEGSIGQWAKSMSTFTFADVQRVIIEAIKTMILDGRLVLKSVDILDQIKLHKSSVASAQSKLEAKRDERGLSTAEST